MPSNDPDSINGALMNFRKGHPLLRLAMMMIPRVYDASRWMVIGPTLLNNVIQQWNYVGCKEDYCINILPTSAFYPIPWFEHEAFFKDSSAVTLPQLMSLNATYAFHFWGAKTSRMRMTSNSLLSRLYRYNCLLCEVPRENWYHTELTEVQQPDEYTKLEISSKFVKKSVTEREWKHQSFSLNLDLGHTWLRGAA